MAFFERPYEMAPELLANFPHLIASDKKVHRSEFAPFTPPPRQNHPQILIKTKIALPKRGMGGFANDPILGEDVLIPLNPQYLVAIRQRFDEMTACIAAWWLAPRSMENPHHETIESITHFRHALQWAELIEHELQRLMTYPQLFPSPAHRRQFFETAHLHLRHLHMLVSNLLDARHAFKTFCDEDSAAPDTYNPTPPPRNLHPMNPTTGKREPAWRSWLRVRPLPWTDRNTSKTIPVEYLFPHPSLTPSPRFPFVAVGFQTIPLPALLIIERWRRDFERMVENVEAVSKDPAMVRALMPADEAHFFKTLTQGRYSSKDNGEYEYYTFVTGKGYHLDDHRELFNYSERRAAPAAARRVSSWGRPEATWRKDGHIWYRVTYKKVDDLEALLQQQQQQRVQEVEMTGDGDVDMEEGEKEESEEEEL